MKFEFKPNSVIILAGASHSGKSTFAKALKEKLMDQGKTVKIVSSDSLRRELLGLPESADARTIKVLGVSAQAFNLLYAQIEAHTTYPVNTDYVIVDTTGLSQAFRDKVNSIAKQNNYANYLVVFEYNERTLLERNKLPIMIPVIKKQVSDVKRKLQPNLNSKEYLKIYRIRKEFDDFFVETLSSSFSVIKYLRQENNHLVLIGDVHECVTTLKTMVTEITAKYENPLIYLLGDWLDKGNNTKEMIEYLLDNPQIDLIKGNHENYVYRKLKDPSFVYTLNEETQHFSSLPVLLADEELREKFFYLYENSYEYLQVDTNYLQVIATHSPCEEKYLGKTDPKSLKHIHKQSFNYDVPPVEQVDYLFKEAAINTPYHVFGHMNVAKESHTYKNKISIDQGCVEGHTLTACVFDLSLDVEQKPQFVYVTSENKPTKPLKSFDNVLNKIKQADTSKFEKLDPQVIKHINRLLKQGNIFMSPTMSPAPSYWDETEYRLEDVKDAISYFKEKGVTEVIAQTKYMGSRCQSYIFPKLEDCYAISRNGWKIKKSDWLDEELEKQWNKYKDMIVSDYLVLDNELMPWSALGKGLIEDSFNPYYNFINEELKGLQEFNYIQFNTDLNIDNELELISKFKTQLDTYGVETKPYLQPFGVIYNGQSLLNEPQDILCQQYSIEFTKFDLNNEEDCNNLALFYKLNTANGKTEGIVIKPNVWNKNIIPYMKVRNPEYLRLVYGYNYDQQLKKFVTTKRITGKARTSCKEQNLNVRLMACVNDEERFNIYAEILNEFEREKHLDPRL